jgi:hypothetical protein
MRTSIADATMAWSLSLDANDSCHQGLGLANNSIKSSYVATKDCQIYFLVPIFAFHCFKHSTWAKCERQEKALSAQCISGVPALRFVSAPQPPAPLTLHLLCDLRSPLRFRSTNIRSASFRFPLRSRFIHSPLLSCRISLPETGLYFQYHYCNKDLNGWCNKNISPVSFYQCSINNYRSVLLCAIM